ncbi:hypothetical protein GCM10007169_01140 [Shewanella fodinae]|nr:hypothetical protein GCM10007169_01140 [Shewanella fodinae]
MMKQEKKYMPKGSMCMSCVKRPDNCANLNFRSMRPHSEVDGIVYVICREFVSYDRA